MALNTDRPGRDKQNAARAQKGPDEYGLNGRQTGVVHSKSTAADVGNLLSKNSSGLTRTS